jgi:PKD repeat protein
VVPITVNKAAPVITWAAPSSITYPTALSSTQLDATASVPGTFVYTPAAGTVLNPGTYTLSTTFTPTDAVDYATVTATVPITVNGGNQPPTAGLTGNPTSGNAPLTVNFSGAASSDPNPGGTITSYTFSFGDGSTPVTQSSPTISHTYTAAGTYTATLTVTDNYGKPSSATSITVTVSSTGAGAGGAVTLNIRFHYSDNTSGSWSATVAGAASSTNPATVTISGSMEGNLPVNPGDTVRAGYDFSLPGTHPASIVTVTGGSVNMNISCPNGTTQMLTISLPAQTYSIAANDNSWHPSGDQSSSLVYQGSTTAQTCSGGQAPSGATFTANFQ